MGGRRDWAEDNGPTREDMSFEWLGEQGSKGAAELFPTSPFAMTS